MSYLIGFLIGLVTGLLVGSRYGPVCDRWLRHYCWIPDYGFWSCLCGKVGGSFGKHGVSYDEWAGDESVEYYKGDEEDTNGDH